MAYHCCLSGFGLRGAVGFFVGFEFCGRRVANKLGGEGDVYCDLMLRHSKVTKCCSVSLNNQKRSLRKE